MEPVSPDPSALALLEFAVDACLLASLSLTVFHDLKSRRIYDWITGPTFLAGLVLGGVTGHVAGGDALAGVLNALLGTLPGVVVFGLPALFGAMGMGDAKLMAATGALLGFPAALGALLAVTLAGGLQGVGALLLRTGPGRRLSARAGLRDATAPDFLVRVPYGLAIAAGVALFRLWQRLDGAP